MKKLYRDTANEKIAGVCSGIARYLNVDPTIVRLIWVFAILFLGWGLLAYIICAIVIPADPGFYDYTEYENQQNNTTTYYNPDINGNNNQQ